MFSRQGFDLFHSSTIVRKQKLKRDQVEFAITIVPYLKVPTYSCNDEVWPSTIGLPGITEAKSFVLNENDSLMFMCNGK